MMHPSTRNHLRLLLEAELQDLVANLGKIDAGDAQSFLSATQEIVDATRHLAELMTHHIEDKSAEQPRETRAALHLFRNVLRNVDVIRDAEVKLGLGDGANTKPHILLRDLRTFLDGEKRAAEFEDARQVDEVAGSKAASAGGAAGFKAASVDEVAAGFKAASVDEVAAVVARLPAKTNGTRNGAHNLKT